jgi:hypothetical protein
MYTSSGEIDHIPAEQAILAQAVLAQLEEEEQINRWIEAQDDFDQRPLAMHGFALALFLAAGMWLGIGVVLWRLFA